MNTRRNEIIDYIIITVNDYNRTRSVYNDIAEDKHERFYDDRTHRLRRLSFKLKQLKRELKHYHRQISLIDDQQYNNTHKHEQSL